MLTKEMIRLINDIEYHKDRVESREKTIAFQENEINKIHQIIKNLTFAYDQECNRQSIERYMRTKRFTI